MQSGEQWANEQFGKVRVGDKRLVRRVVEMAAQMAQRPSDSLPKQLQGEWSEQQAGYRLLDNVRVNHEALSRPHWEATRKQSEENGSVVLMVQDFTSLDYSHHPATAGLGSIGRSKKQQGLMVHNTLAVLPEGRQVLGLAYQQVWTRSGKTYKNQETQVERRKRNDRQSQRWSQAVKALGKPPEGVRWVHVGDRESDIFEFIEQTGSTGVDYCIRVAQNRRLEGWAAPEPSYLLDQVRQLPTMGQRLLSVPAKAGQKKRQAALSISWQQVTIRSPKNAPGKRTISAWVLRAWEQQPPPDGEALEWVLLTSVAVTTLADALERLDWYTCRWIVEEYHSCLKTGCGIEDSQLQHADRLQRLLGFHAILAVRLLQLRDLARSTPTLRAVVVIQPVLVQIMAYQTKSDPNTMTVYGFWREVAKIGGFLARKSDREPGWKALWHGWLRLLDWAAGVRFAQNLPPLEDVYNP